MKRLVTAIAAALFSALALSSVAGATPPPPGAPGTVYHFTIHPAAPAGSAAPLPGAINCVESVQQPLGHPGAYGFWNIVTVTDVIDCDHPGVTYFDRLYLDLYLRTKAASNAGGTISGVWAYGWYTVNQAAFACAASPVATPWYGVALTQVFYAGAEDSNLPGGYAGPVAFESCGG